MGLLKKIGKAIGKGLKGVAKIAPIAASFIPGIGPLAAAGISAGSALIRGKGIKGAVTGGLSSLAGTKLLGKLGAMGKTAGASGKANSILTGAKGALGKLGTWAKANPGQAIGAAGAAYGLYGQHQTNKANQRYMQDQLNLRESALNQGNANQAARQPLRDAAFARLAQMLQQQNNNVFQVR